MKSTLIALSIAVAGTASAVAQENVLVAGWDFQFSAASYYYLTPAGVLPANYSDKYTPPYHVNDGGPSALRGTFYLDGTNGSDLWTFWGPLASVTKASSMPDIDWQIKTRDGGTKLGQFGFLIPASLGLDRTSATRSKIAFVINTQGIGALDEVVYRTRMSNMGEASIDWSLRVGEATWDLSGPIGVSGSVFQTQSVSLAGVALNGASNVTLIGTVNNPSTSTFMLLDNLAFYGFTAAAAIPEPGVYAAAFGLLGLALPGLRRFRTHRV